MFYYSELGNCPSSINMAREFPGIHAGSRDSGQAYHSLGGKTGARDHACSYCIRMTFMISSN